jgi:integrase
LKRARKPKGSVVFNKARGTWNFLWPEAGQRKSRKLGTLAELPTRADALRKAEAVRRELRLVSERTGVTVNQLVQQYREEKMPSRMDTRRAYEVWLSNHIIPRWGGCVISDIQARPVELWLTSLPLAPKSKVHVRGVLSLLWDFAMWRGDVPVQRNPMELVTVKGATKRTKKPRSLAAVEFQKFIQHLDEPFRTMALLCVCFGLRISEALALKWRDVDWLNGKLTVERGIVCQIVDNVKTPESQRSLHIDSEMLEVLKHLKQASQFSGPEDWLFASPVKMGRLPWSYDQVWRMYQKAATKAGIGMLGTHALRHTYRSWLDAVGTPVAVQQKLMRHADIRTTMNIYGDVVTDEMAQAHSKVVRIALAKVN